MSEKNEYPSQKQFKGTPFANGLFSGLFLGIVIAIIITLIVTSGKSPFISKKTEGSCIEVNSALGDEDVINIDEDANIDNYAEAPDEEQPLTLDNERNVLLLHPSRGFFRKKISD